MLYHVEKDSAPCALKRPDDEVQRMEKFDFPPIWQRGASMTSPSMKATSGSNMELDDPSLTAHAFLIHRSIRSQMIPPSERGVHSANRQPELTEPTSEREHLAFANNHHRRHSAFSFAQDGQGCDREKHNMKKAMMQRSELTERKR